MEKLTKRILAIVLIAVIGVGIGVTVWIFVAPYSWTAADVPGMEGQNITEDQIIRIGVAGDTKRIHGEGQYHGAWLAAYQINTGTGPLGEKYFPDGGIQIGGTKYYIGITSEDTDEANPILDITKGKVAADRLVFYKNIQFALGGFRTESLLAYRDVFMENKIPFINTGSATDSFTEDVLNNYDKYKYFFQNNPIKAKDLAKELITLIITTSYTKFLFSGGALNISRFAFVREDLQWTADFADIMIFALQNNPMFNLTYTGENIAIPQDIGETVMNANWATINAAHTQLVIPIISGEAGLIFSTTYGTYKPNCTILGINVMSQDAAYWDQTDGLCEYGATLESVLRTNKTSLTIPMWDSYIAKWGDTPIYTAVGAYDAVLQYAWAINASQSFNPDTIVATLETLTTDNPLEGAAGWGAFDNANTPPNDKTRHCIVEGWPYGVALLVQWFNGSKILVPGVGVYPSGILSPASLSNMEPYRLPWWGIHSPTPP